MSPCLIPNDNIIKQWMFRLVSNDNFLLLSYSQFKSYHSGLNPLIVSDFTCQKCDGTMVLNNDTENMLYTQIYT